MVEPVKQRMGAGEWGLLAALSLLWGGSFLFVGVAVRELGPLTIVALRVGLAALALLPVLKGLGVPVPTTRPVLLAFLGMGVLNNVIPFTLMTWGQGHIASGLAAILNATTPLFGVLVAHALTSDEKLTPGRFAGVLVGFAGVAVMIGAGALESLGTALLAQMAVLTGALSYAFAGVFGRRFKRLGVPPLATAAGQVTASSLILVPLALAIERPFAGPMPSATTVAAVLALALVSTALAYVLFFRLLAAAGATNLLLVTLLIPVSAVLLGALVLDETLAPRHALGMGLIAAGLALIDGRLLGAFAVKASARPRSG
jgi:drug/metabolite transporter (DMT)-like permease